MIKTIGIMTGNSLDAVDAVLTSFDEKSIRDEGAFSLAYPPELKEKFLALKNMFCRQNNHFEIFQSDFFRKTVDEYTCLVAKTVNLLLEKYFVNKNDIAAIGFHGQTCDHFPPSIAQGGEPYTLQVGDAQKLADLTDIPVIYDFRSDDIMNGGEGAPLAPLHNLHLAQVMKKQGFDNVAFCNGGNTGNIAVVNNNQVVGWDIGPFNHLPDLLMRKYKNLPYDKNGEFGKKGKVNLELLRKMFNHIAVCADGENFYLKMPPKSSDPHWYQEIFDSTLSFEDNLRTAEYLSAYAFVYNLQYLSSEIELPCLYLLFGGGWKNVVILDDFKKLLKNNPLILPEHMRIFDAIYQRLPKDIVVEFSDKFGFSGEYMEARIFADMAYAKICNQPFSMPEISGCRQPTVDGVFVLPKSPKNYLLQELLEQYNNPAQPENRSLLWSRASKGWQHFSDGI